jgi:hypothetical protein
MLTFETPTCRIFPASWYSLIAARQVVEGDAVGSEPSKALLDLGPERLWPGAGPAALGGDDARFRDRRQRAADRLFALAAGVGVSGVEMADTGGHRRPHEIEARGGRPEAVRSEPDPRHLDVAETQHSGHPARV